jgi:small-conductance mechanosensitive channel
MPSFGILALLLLFTLLASALLAFALLAFALLASLLASALLAFALLASALLAFALLASMLASAWLLFTLLDFLPASTLLAFPHAPARRVSDMILECIQGPFVSRFHGISVLILHTDAGARHFHCQVP